SCRARLWRAWRRRRHPAERVAGIRRGTAGRQLALSSARARPEIPQTRRSPLAGDALALNARWEIRARASPAMRAPTAICARSLPALCRLASLLADDRLFARIDDRLHHAVDIGDAFVELELAGELGIRVQLAQFIQRPHLLAVVRIQQFRRKARQADADVAHVTPQHGARVVVARGT